VASTIASSTELNAAGNIGSFIFSNDGSKVLLFTNSRRVWRLNTRGDYWVFDLQTHRLQQVDRGAPPTR
jgi:dipeptidyl-peptidase-4